MAVEQQMYIRGDRVRLRLADLEIFFCSLRVHALFLFVVPGLFTGAYCGCNAATSWGFVYPSTCCVSSNSPV